MRKLHMKVIEDTEGTFLIAISDQHLSTRISFDYKNKKLNYLKDDTLADFLKTHEFQFRKLLHVKRPETFFKGFVLNFSLREGKNVKAFDDLSKILVLDKRNGQNKNFVMETSALNIHELYVDGSFLCDRNKGGLAVIIKHPDGKYDLETFESFEKSSCLIELEAAIKGLELLKNTDEIRLITDSQYVRKGLTEWIINWKLNDWHTANGEKVKNIQHWKKFDKLSENKYIEFKYVKAHSQQFENTMADLYAKDMARKQ